jgi:hypothetical protein
MSAFVAQSIISIAAIESVRVHLSSFGKQYCDAYLPSCAPAEEIVAVWASAPAERAGEPAPRRRRRASYRQLRRKRACLRIAGECEDGKLSYAVCLHLLRSLPSLADFTLIGVNLLTSLIAKFASA